MPVGNIKLVIVVNTELKIGRTKYIGIFKPKYQNFSQSLKTESMIPKEEFNLIVFLCS